MARFTAVITSPITYVPIDTSLLLLLGFTTRGCEEGKEWDTSLSPCISDRLARRESEGIGENQRERGEEGVNRAEVQMSWVKGGEYRTLGYL